MERITPEMAVAALLDQWPSTARLFVDYRMNCLGCDMSKFDTIKDACKNYNLDPGYFIQQLTQIIQAHPSQNIEG